MVCDIGGKKEGDAVEQEKSRETRIFQDRAHSPSKNTCAGVEHTQCNIYFDFLEYFLYF